MAYQGRTVVSELRERIRDLGGDPKGKTHAQLLDELQRLGGGGGGVTPEDVNRIVSNSLDERLPDAVATAVESAVQTGGLSDEDFDDIFGGD